MELRDSTCPFCRRSTIGDCGAHATVFSPDIRARLQAAERLAERVEAEWFVWDDSGDGRPIAYCNFCGVMHQTKMRETTQAFVKDALNDKHGPECLVTLARAYRAAGKETP